MFKFKQDEAIETGARRIILERLDENITYLTELTPFVDIAVHESRKNFKRIRAVLRLIREEIGPQAYQAENQRYRDASRLLAPLRDAAVIVETLDNLVSQSDLPAGDLSHTRAALAVSYESTRQIFLQTDGPIKHVLATLAAGREVAGQLPGENQGFAACSGGLRRVYRRGRRRMGSAYAAGDDPHAFHDWRKRVKYLWHQLELLEGLWPALLSSNASELKQLSDYLGDANDLAVLRATLAALPREPAEQATRNELTGRLQDRQQELWAAARPLGARLYAEAPAAFVNRLDLYWQAWRQLDGRVSELNSSPTDR